MTLHVYIVSFLFIRKICGDASRLRVILVLHRDTCLRIIIIDFTFCAILIYVVLLYHECKQVYYIYTRQVYIHLAWMCYGIILYWKYVLLSKVTGKFAD